MLNLKVNDKIFTLSEDGPLKLLQAATDVPDLKVGCKRGICGICMVKVKSGIENISAKTEVEEATLAVLNRSGNEFRLLCQCTINGDVSLCNNI